MFWESYAPPAIRIGVKNAFLPLISFRTLGDFADEEFTF
jgi:hypothetical protein